MFGCCYAAVAVRTEDQAEVLEAVNWWFAWLMFLIVKVMDCYTKRGVLALAWKNGLFNGTHVQAEGNHYAVSP